MTDGEDGFDGTCPECGAGTPVITRLGRHLVEHHTEYTGKHDLDPADMDPGDLQRMIAFDHPLCETERAAVMRHYLEIQHQSW